MIFHNKLRKGRVIRVDIPKDGIMAAIFLLPYIAMLILVPLISNCSACKILVYIIFYLSYIALILQDRTNVEFTSNEIIINRFLSGSLRINREEISQTERKQNIFYRFRFPLYLYMILLLLYNINNVYHGMNRVLMRNYPVDELFFWILSRTLIIIFLGVLFYLMERRLRIPEVLEIKTQDKIYKFYSSNPEDFKTLM
jgi:hypothetical protein